MFLGVIALDVGYTIATGTQASSAVTQHINFTPDGDGLLGGMERLGRTMDQAGHEVFGRYTGLFEMALYGILTPLLIAMPLAWEAHRRQWSRRGSVVLIGLAALVIGTWLAWKYPDPAALFYAMVNVTLLASQAIGVSYYTGCLIYFVILPVLVATGYGALAWARDGRMQTTRIQTARMQDQEHSGSASEHEVLEHAASEGASALSTPSDWLFGTEGRMRLGFRISLGLAVGGAVLLVGLWLVSRPAQPERPPPSEALRVAMANLHAQNAQPRAASEALAAMRPDVLVLREWTGHNAELNPLQEAGLEVVGSDARNGTHGSALLARPGIVESVQIIPPPWQGDCAMPVLTAYLRLNGAPVGLFGIHAPPPVPDCRASRTPYHQALTELVADGRTVRAVGAIPANTPVIATGDFNSHKWETPIRTWAQQGLTDAFDAGTWRLGPTWTFHTSVPAFVTIDYIWMPETWKSKGAWTAYVPGSDHRAVVADVVRPQD